MGACKTSHFMLLHDILCFTHKAIDIPSISLRSLDIGSDETAGYIVNVLELFRCLFAVEFEANWAGGHDSKCSFRSRDHISLDRKIANGFWVIHMQLCPGVEAEGLQSLTKSVSALLRRNISCRVRIPGNSLIIDS
jgi:hypothetical protein